MALLAKILGVLAPKLPLYRRPCSQLFKFPHKMINKNDAYIAHIMYTYITHIHYGQ